MTQDFLQEAKKEIAACLAKQYKNVKFTVKFGGEFFVAAANKSLDETQTGCEALCVGRTQIYNNKVNLYLSDTWVQGAVAQITQTDCHSTQLFVRSQISRLEKQLEFGLCGGVWDERAHLLARDILYMMHTKSASIRANIVKKCAREYNIIQRQGRVPEKLVRGYRNALCQISELRG